MILCFKLLSLSPTLLCFRKKPGGKGRTVFIFVYFLCLRATYKNVKKCFIKFFREEKTFAVSLICVCVCVFVCLYFDLFDVLIAFMPCGGLKTYKIHMKRTPGDDEPESNVCFPQKSIRSERRLIWAFYSAEFITVLVAC